MVIHIPVILAYVAAKTAYAIYQRVSNQASEPVVSSTTLQRLKDLAILGLDEAATQVAIESAFRRLVQVHHPDRVHGQDEETVRAAAQAFQMLRAAYDRLMAGRQS